MDAQSAQRVLAPHHVEFLRKAEEAVRANRLEQAVAVAQEGLSSGCIHPLLLNLRAFWYEQEGRDWEALADLQLAVSMAPDDAPACNAYGLALARARRHRESIKAFRDAIAAQPQFAQAHYNLGWALEALPALDEAATAYQAALVIDANYPDPMGRLANLAARAGRWDEARNYARRALAIDPRQTAALAAECNAAIATKEFDLAEMRIAEYRRACEALPLEMAQTKTVLGDLRHAQGRFAEAFACYSQGNLARRVIYADQFEGSGRETAYDGVTWLTKYFTSPVLDVTWSAVRSDPSAERAGAKLHVFFVGFPRSGTTLAENILASHPAVVSLEEKGTLDDAVRAFLKNPQGLDELSRLSPQGVEKYRRMYWDRVSDYLGSIEQKVFIDKHPLNCVKLPIVAKLFPNAKILFAIRDPRDVVLSCFRRAFQMNPSMYEFLSLPRAAQFYGAVMSLSKLYRQKLSLGWHDLRHEPMIEDLQGQMSEVCRFLDLDWHPTMREFAEHAKSRSIATPSSMQIVRGLNRDGVGQWRNYRDEMAPAMPMLRPWVEKFGYDTD